MKNRIFQKTISFDRVFYGFDPENILHFYFRFKWFPNSNAQREREREHEERLERARLGSCRRAQTTTSSPDAPLSSCRQDLAARSCHRDHTVKITLGRSFRRDHTPLDRTVRSSHCPLDRTLFVSISVPPKAYSCWTSLVAHDPPMTDLSLSRSTSPFPLICDHSLFLLPLSVWPNSFVY